MTAARGEDLSGSEYLQEVLGDVLAKALSSVAQERPEDPVSFVAEYLYKVSYCQSLCWRANPSGFLSGIFMSFFHD